MESYSEIHEHELERAVEVKEKDSLHRAVRLIVERIESMQVRIAIIDPSPCQLCINRPAV